MRVASSQIYDGAIAAFQRQQLSAYETQQQIATGVAVQHPHQAPSEAVTIERLQQFDARLLSYQRNSDAMANQLGLEDSALADMTQLLQRVRELSVQAGDAALGRPGRAALAAELRGALHNLATLANTADAHGHPIFAASHGERRPVQAEQIGALVAAEFDGEGAQRSLWIGESRQMRMGTATAAGALRTDSANALRTRAALGNAGEARLVSAFVSDAQAWAGGALKIVFSGAERFDVVDASGAVVAAAQDYRRGEPIRLAGVTLAIDGAVAAGDEFHIEPASGKDAFTVVNQLIDALDVGDAERLSTMVDTTLDDLDGLQESVSIAQVTVGARMNALDVQRSNNEAMRFEVEKTLSSTRDTDYATAITRLRQAMTALEAAQASFARIERTSLFDLI